MPSDNDEPLFLCLQAMDSDKINGIACCSHPEEEGSVSCCVQNIFFSLILNSSVNDIIFLYKKTFVC